MDAGGPRQDLRPGQRPGIHALRGERRKDDPRRQDRGRPVAIRDPGFSADLQSIVFNPEWTVPPTIVRENLLPNLRGGGWFGGSSVLREHGLKVKYNGRIVDPGSINWGSVNMGSVAFVQAPGPTNVLGKLKFVYPNKHMVYMHDTIKRGLFKPAMRAEGHNCIRMERPGKLAEILLAEDQGWDAKKVQDLLAKGYDSAVNLQHPIPVHTTYFTATADADGKVDDLRRRLRPRQKGGAGGGQNASRISARHRRRGQREARCGGKRAQRP